MTVPAGITTGFGDGGGAGGGVAPGIADDSGRFKSAEEFPAWAEHVLNAVFAVCKRPSVVVCRVIYEVTSAVCDCGQPLVCRSGITRLFFDPTRIRLD